MPLVPISLPPGIYKNGTPYGAKNRWYDSNLIRWHNESIRPIGGWVRARRSDTGAEMFGLYANPAVETARDGFGWRKNNNDRCLAFGSNLKVYFIPATNIPLDITPTAITTSSNDTAVLSGYGIGTYGTGPYGIENIYSPVEVVGPTRWSFDNWGEELLALQQGVGGIYKYATGDARLLPIAGAPTNNRDLIVTDERIVMVAGADGFPRLVRWSDQENRNDWTPSIINQAGDYTLPGAGRLQRIVNVNSMLLLLSENDAYTAQYVGPPYVYSFVKAGDFCGPVSPAAVVSGGSFAVWLGVNKFWLFDGTVKPLPCEVIDFIMEDANKSKWSKMTAHMNSEYNEVWWQYQSNLSNDVDSYVAWNYVTNTWVTGRLGRSAAVDAGIFDSIFMLSMSGHMFIHEQEYQYPDGEVFVETGPLEFGEGDKNLAVRYVFIDTDVKDNVRFKFKTKQLPTAPEVTGAAIPYSNPMSPRAMGRQVRMRIEGLTEPFEAGTMRFDVAAVGTGMR